LEKALHSLHPELDPEAARRTRPGPPLTFPKGHEAATRRELLALCVRYWDYAKDILYKKSIGRWLEGVLHDPAAARVAQAAVSKYPNDPDAGLDYFVRALDPQAMPLPKLRLVTRQIQLETTEEQDRSQQIQVGNVGGGYLYGKLSSSQEWIRTDEPVRCAPGQTQSIPLLIDTRKLVPGHTYRAEINVRASNAQTASIPLEVRIPPPVVDVVPTAIDLGTVSRKELLTAQGVVDSEGGL
jgi:hypothetical protein